MRLRCETCNQVPEDQRLATTPDGHAVVNGNTGRAYARSVDGHGSLPASTPGYATKKQVALATKCEGQWSVEHHEIFKDQRTGRWFRRFIA